MSDKLREVTYLTVNELKEQDIVLPGKYSSIFENYAKKLEIEIDNQDVILKELHQDCEHVNKIVNKTNDNLCVLKKSTSDARTAIENKDKKSLENIYSELEKMQEQINFLQRELFSDNLTKAYNRKWFKDYYLNDGLFSSKGAIAFIDLDKFKAINDSFGHLIGDQVLRYLVKFLSTELNFDGVNIIRYAGDEFLITFDEKMTNQMDVSILLKTLQLKLSQQKLKTTKINNIQFSFSYGLVSHFHGDSLEYVLDKADELMYKNKKRAL